MATPIVDCDPGRDDAVEILLAPASLALEVLGISTTGCVVDTQSSHRCGRMTS